MSHSSVSSTACRTQEAYHRDRSTAAPLANVRAISANAAIAWAREAVLAEKREAKVTKPHPNDPLIELLSENPDREHADAPAMITKKDDVAAGSRASLADWENEGGAS